MGPHCIVTLWTLVSLTLEPIKSHYVQYLQCGWLLDGLTQSPSETVPLDLPQEDPEASLAGRQSVALWEEGVWNSLCLFTGTPWDGVSSSDLVGVSNRLFRPSNLVLLAVCGSQSDSSELLLVTPLAFSDLALAHTRRVWCWSPLDMCITLELVCC